ncbi:MAG TPA: DUF433 domain-containing protein [Planctomycetota bacterium]|nr:DUF433 domain-containing protein [Planctomycetota bacterium]
MSARIMPDTERIEGTRTSVYHVMDFYVENAAPETIARELRLSVEQVQAALDFIEANKEHVKFEYQKMLDRCARGNPPEIEAMAARSHEKLLKLAKELRARAETCR